MRLDLAGEGRLDPGRLGSCLLGICQGRIARCDGLAPLLFKLRALLGKFVPLGSELFRSLLHRFQLALGVGKLSLDLTEFGFGIALGLFSLVGESVVLGHVPGLALAKSHTMLHDGDVSATEIRQVRLDLGLTQAQMASLMNIHPVTVSRWENEREEKYAPSAYQESILRAFMKACADDPSLKERAARVLLGLGVAAAMFTILRAAFADANI